LEDQREPCLQHDHFRLRRASFSFAGLVEIANRQPGMMTRICLGIVIAFDTSLVTTLGFFEVEVWWELASLITVMLLGYWLEIRAVSQARGALDALAALLPDTAERIDGAEATIPLQQVNVGDVVLVRPGTRVSADGTVVDGSADVDESMIIGESRAVPKTSGALLIAGTVASGGSLRVRVTAIDEQTAATAQLLRRVKLQH
jgi:Cu2+-exporting ATPase